MADFEKVAVYTAAIVLQVTARVADLATVWLLANFERKQIPQTWMD